MLERTILEFDNFLAEILIEGKKAVMQEVTSVLEDMTFSVLTNEIPAFFSALWHGMGTPQEEANADPINLDDWKAPEPAPRPQDTRSVFEFLEIPGWQEGA